MQKLLNTCMHNCIDWFEIKYVHHGHAPQIIYGINHSSVFGFDFGLFGRSTITMTSTPEG